MFKDISKFIDGADTIWVNTQSIKTISISNNDGSYQVKIVFIDNSDDIYINCKDRAEANRIIHDIVF